MNWTIYLNDTEVDEPKGLAEIVLNIIRDDQWHGMFFEASTSTLTFYGNGADLITAEKRANGLASSMTFRAEADCGESVDILEGSLDFNTYREKCGTTCGVEIAVEKSGCIMTMRNRYDQKVDLGKATAFDNTTLLPNYVGLNIYLELLAQKLSVGDEAETTPDPVTETITGNPNWVQSDGLGNYIGWIAPALPTVTNSSLGEFNTSPIILLAGPLEGVPNRPPWPDFPTAVGTATLLGDITCELVDTEARFRLKGSGTVVIAGSGAVGMELKLFHLPAGLDGTVAVNWTQLYVNAVFSRTTTGTSTFDTGDVVVPLTLAQGDFVYWGLSTRGSTLSNINHFEMTLDVETYYKLMTSATCEPTFADTTLINETGSRIVEAITDGCLNLKSDYYGRIDSEPYTSAADGCGGLRVLANGLSLRRATPDNHFISLQEFFTGLRGIDNIGMGIEPNTVLPGSKEWLRIEPVEYFYQNVELLSLPFIPEAASNLESRLGYSKILIGYNMWEVERVNGLGEFNSNKEFRTSLKTLDNTLDAQSNFVAGGIPIEITRQQAFATSGAADTKYDNETFIICVERGGYDYVVEKGNIDNPANIFSPATAYNWRIRPMYNLMRWFKSIAQSYVSLVSTTSKLFFSSGKGNYIAEGELPAGDPCKLEDEVIAENDDLSYNQFAADDYIPIYQPEIITFEYPLSIADYVRIKANPYGYISLQCGRGDYQKAFIKSIAYKPVEGTAAFSLILKWQ